MCEEDVMVLNGACGRVFVVSPLIHLQILVTKYLTSSYILAQKCILTNWRELGCARMDYPLLV